MPAGAVAAPPKLGIPSEIKIKAGAWAKVSPDTDAKAVVYISLDGLAPFPNEELRDPRKLIVFAAASGRYRFVAIGTLGDELAVVEFVLVVGDVPPGPGPAPPPDPVPPLPVDPLAVALKSAAAADGWPAANLSALATGFKVAASRVESRATLADIQGMAATTLKDNAAAKTPPGVRAVLAKELAALDGPDRPATDADKAGIKALFTRLAAALDGASK